MYKKELDSGTLLFIEATDGDFNHAIEDCILKYKNKSTMFYYETLALPQGNWQLLGFSTDLTEQQLKDVMPPLVEILDWPENADLSNVKDISSLEQFQSLKISLGLIDGNPIPVPQFQYDERGNGGYCESWVRSYEEEQSKVKKLIVLFNPKK